MTLLNPSVLDIKAQSESSKMFHVEIQVTDEADYDQRALYYLTKMYTQQLKEGDDYSKLNKTIGIHMLNFTSITDTDKYHNIFMI